MTQAEMRQAVAEGRMAAAIQKLSEYMPPADDVVEGEDEFAEEFDEGFGRGQALLDAAMLMLGFFGDAEIGAALTKADRAKMIELAEEIRQYLTDLEVATYEEWFNGD